MRFENFIINEGRTQGLSFDKAAELIMKHCPKTLEQYKKGQALWRGAVSVKADYAYVEPSKSSRESANTGNHYTLWLDNSSKWKAFPKRSQSLICISDSSNAYPGNKYLVLPYDGSNVGICSDADFWDSFYKTYGSDMNSFNGDLGRAYNLFTNNPDSAAGRSIDKDWNTLNKAVDVMDTIWSTYSPQQKKKIPHNFLYYLVKKNERMSIREFIDYVLDPNANDFKLGKSGDKLPITPSKPLECWTDGNAVLVNLNSAVNHNDPQWEEFLANT